jgi:hypothetical protein
VGAVGASTAEVFALAASASAVVVWFAADAAAAAPPPLPAELGMLLRDATGSLEEEE